MIINVIYGQGAANNAAPSGFYTAVNYVVGYYDSLFTNNVTININVDYGSILDPYTNTYSKLSSGDLGESYDVETSTSYAATTSALLSENAPGASTLPSSSPDLGSLYMGSAEAKALGLLGASITLDGSVGISAASSNTSWDYSATATPTANQYYLAGVLEHEISEVMGRVSDLDTHGEYTVADLYRYSAPGVRDLTTGGNGSTAYFSIDNGSTNLGSWNNQVSNGDLADWYPQGPAPGGNDAYNDYSNPGVINSVSATDITLMQALGWTAAVATVNVKNVYVVENTPVAASSFITLSNPTGDNITQFTLVDTGTNGHFTVNGVNQPDGHAFNVSDLSSVQYVGGSAPGSDTLNVQFYDSTTNSESNVLSLTATTKLPNVVNDSITELYVGYLNRAQDPTGESYWAGQIQGGMALSQIAQSFSVQTESTSLYSFLANPNTANTAAVQAFITAVYANLFSRTPDVAGENYWVNQLQTEASTVGGVIINIISGAQSSDLLTLDNKVVVGDYYDTQIYNHNVQFSLASAKAALSSVTFNTSSIATAEAIVDAYVNTAPSATITATGSQSDVSLVGTVSSHGLINAT